MAKTQLAVELDDNEKLRLTEAAHSSTFTAAVKGHQEALKELPKVLAQICKGVSTSDEITFAREKVEAQKKLLDSLVDSDGKSTAQLAIEEAEAVLDGVMRDISNSHQA